MKKLLLNRKMFNSSKLVKAAGLLSICLLSQFSNAQLTFTVDNSSEWSAYANWYQLDGTTYVAGGTWGLADLKTDVNSDNTLTLYPNYNTYGTGEDPTYWTNGNTGNKVFEGNTFKENLAWANNTVTFKGRVLSNTLATGYTAVAYIKALNPQNNYSLEVNETVALVSGQEFTITVPASRLASGYLVQYGFAVKGINANPTAMAQNGNAKVGATSLSIENFTQDNKTTVYPNPANNVLNIKAASVIESAAVYNMVGQKVMDKKINVNETALDVSSLANGVYILNTTINGQQSATRFVKQ